MQSKRDVRLAFEHLVSELVEAGLKAHSGLKLEMSSPGDGFTRYSLASLEMGPLHWIEGHVGSSASEACRTLHAMANAVRVVNHKPDQMRSVAVVAS